MCDVLLALRFHCFPHFPALRSHAAMLQPLSLFFYGAGCIIFNLYDKWLQEVSPFVSAMVESYSGVQG